jgi:NADH dehydrogenase FAD-containing subunit
MADPSTNSMIVSGSGADIELASAVVKELDTAQAAEGKRDVQVVPLKGGKARDMANILRNLFAQQQQQGHHNQPQAPSTLKIESDPSDTCLIISASPNEWTSIQEILKKVDANVPAASVDPAAKQVKTGDGSVLAYDKLIYAAGARCFRPPIPGMEFDNVISIRSARDAVKIISLLPTVKQAVVIGGGVLGIEAAWELHQAGASVTVVETMPRIMSRQLDEGAARTLSMKMELKGMQLRTGAGVCAIEGEEEAQRVVLKSGEVLPANLVIVSTGVTPNAELLSAAGAKVKRIDYFLPPAGTGAEMLQGSQEEIVDQFIELLKAKGGVK